MNTLIASDASCGFADHRPKKAQSAELIQAARDVLLQGLGLLFELGDNTYSRSAGAPFHSAIAMHYCQALEQFQSLVRGTRAAEIRYGCEAANPRLVGEVSYASVATCDILRALKAYSSDTLSRECRVINGAGSAVSKAAVCESTIGEEMVYCIGQALHHYGIIRLISQELGIAVPADLGTVPTGLNLGE